MKTTSFSIETGRYKFKPSDTRYELTDAAPHPIEGLEDGHLMLNTYVDPDLNSILPEATQIAITNRNVEQLAHEILNHYA